MNLRSSKSRTIRNYGAAPASSTCSPPAKAATSSSPLPECAALTWPRSTSSERDLGLTDCNIARRAYGLAKERIFDHATSNLAVQADCEASAAQSTTSTCG